VTRWGPVVAVVLAALVALVVWRSDGPAEKPGDAGRLAPVEVTSDAARLASLQDLLELSDLVVRAEVTGTERGRVFANPGGRGAIESRVVHLRVTTVLRGAGAEAGDRLLVEEEGWTAEGAPLVVDGLAPSTTGDDAVWFLIRAGDDEEARYVVVSAEGRYLVRGDRLVGAAGDDPLVAQLTALGAAGLEAAVASSP
jgi:hypothetical protein